MTDLGTLGGSSSYGYRIDGAGRVVGKSQISNGTNRAFIYSDGVMTDLNTFLPSGAGFTVLYEARAINSLGQIVGAGAPVGGGAHAFLMTPVAMCRSREPHSRGESLLERFDSSHPRATFRNQTAPAFVFTPKRQPMRMRTTLLPLAALLLAGCDIEDWGNSRRYHEDFKYTYNLKPGGRLSLESYNGKVEITGWDQNNVEIAGTKYAESTGVLAAIKIEIAATDDAIAVRTTRPTDGRDRGGASYVIRVPRRVELDRISSSNGSMRVEGVEGKARLQTSNGSVDVSKTGGGVDARTSNGGIDLHEVRGGASLRTSNGHVRAERVNGPFEAHTSNGGIDVRLTEAEAGRPVRLETSNGHIDLSMEKFQDNEVRASTSNGGITLTMPASLQAKLRAHASRNSIKTDFEVRTTSFDDKHSLNGSIGNGGALLDLTTSNGGISLRRH